MKVTKRQLRRIIKEQLGPKEIEYQGEEWHKAWDALNEGLVNLVADAIDAGLLEDDLNSAWGETKVYVRDMLEQEGGVWSDEKDFEAGFMS